MKKIMNIFVLVAAAAMALVSCNKQEVEAPKPQEVEYEYTFEIAGDTKATIGDDCVVWELGDQIGVYTDGQNGLAHNTGAVTLGSPVSFSIVSSNALFAGDNVHCYYPYALESSEDVRMVHMSIETAQTEKNQMPMVSLPFAVTENLAANTEKPVGEILFANLGSVIEFNVYSTTEEYQTEYIQSVAFNADQAIAGNFTFDLTAVDYSKEETLAISGYEETTVVSTLSTPVAVPATKETAKVVKMVVAPGSYTGNVVVTTDKATYTFPITSAKEFKRSAVKPLGLNFRENVREENTSSEPVEVTATISFANTNQRTALSTSMQVWENAGVVFTNSKGASTSNVADYSNPARFYKSSDITITAPGKITKIVFNSEKNVSKDNAYLDFLTGVVGNKSVDGTKVTVDLDGTSNNVTYALTQGQVRLYDITVTYLVAGETPDEPDQPENPEPEVVTLSSIKVSDDAKTEYTVGDPFVEPTVTATYSDGSTKEVDAVFIGYDMAVADTYIVNVSYTENEVTVTDSYEIVVNAKEDSEIVAHTVTWNLAKDETSEASDSKIAWDSDGVSMVNSKGTAQSGANNYYPGVDNRTSTRFYSGNSLKISPKEGYAINSVVFTATTEGYATALKNSTWSNASAIVSGTTVTVNPADGCEDILASITGTCGFTKVVVDLVPSEDYVKPIVVLSSIALSGQTTNYTVGDTFSFTGTVTATYSNGATKTVTPTQVSTPDMSTAGDKEVTVTYTEGGVTTTAKYTITVSAAAATKKYYEKVTTAPTDWSGTYLIVAGTSAANGTITSKWLKYNSVSISNNQIESTAAVDAIAVTIKKESNGNYSIRFANGKYLGTTTSNDGIKVATSVGDGFYWKFSVASSLVKIESTVQSSRILRLNGTSGFRTYTSSTGTQATLYKLQD